MKLTHGVKEDKKGHLERLLQFGTVMIFVDSRRDGVLVPPEHQTNPQLPLNLDYAFEIPDFRILDDRVEVSLSFNKKDFFCVLPFPSIYGARSIPAAEFVVFFDDVPAELLSTLPPRPTEIPVAATSEPEEPKPRKKGHLKLVK